MLGIGAQSHRDECDSKQCKHGEGHANGSRGNMNQVSCIVCRRRLVTVYVKDSEFQ